MLLFLKGFKIQLRVIHALILRETRTRFDRNKLGYLWALFEPVTYIIALISIFSVMGRNSPIGGDNSLPMFFLTGIVPWLLFSHTVNKTMQGITSNKTLLAYPQVTPFDVLTSRALLEFATMSVVFTLVYLGFWYLGYHSPLDSFREMILCFITLWLFAIGIGFMNSSIKLYLPSYGQTYNAIQRPFFFISGVFFTVDSLPIGLQKIALYNPILHAIEWFRSAVFTNYESKHVDIPYLLTFVILFLAIGLSAERISRKYARQI